MVDSVPDPRPDPVTGNGDEHPRVLVVDDEPALRSVIREFLESRGFLVDEESGGKGAIDRAGRQIYDAILLDLAMPELSGEETVARMRDAGITTPILVLTGKGADRSLVTSLEAGADDFLAKPVSFPALEARLHALIRRGGLPGAVSAGPIRLDPLRHRAWIEGQEIRLTKVEFLLLATLVRARGEPVSRDQLLKDVWEMDFDPGTNLVYTHIANLRAKLSQKGADHLVEVERGKGYRLRLS
jgi:two-component system OmpR family response regulator